MKSQSLVNPFDQISYQQSAFSAGFGLMHLTRLQTLRLDSNKLTLIRSDELVKLTQLRNLDLSDCPIENLDVRKSLLSLSLVVHCLALVYQ